jgi:type III pantothenate kinase
MDADGVFRGGVIMPGLQLMLGSLAEKTAALSRWRRASTRIFRQHRRCAVLRRGASGVGCDRADAFAVEQQGADVKCFISGARRARLPRLKGRLELVDNLVLEGVLVLAQSAMNSAD